jgi:hypothetical protein
MTSVRAGTGPRNRPAAGTGPRNWPTAANGAVTSVAAISAALALAACGSAASTAGLATPQISSIAPSASQSATPSPTLTPTATPTPTPTASGPLAVAPGAGSLPQTNRRPRTSGPAFHALVTDLWLAVRADRPSDARPAFFPVGAYKQVKAIYDPASDWRYRLWLDFTLDVRAAHALLRPDAKAARLIRVIVPSAEVVWVGPDACYNRVGYWHVAGPRVVYRQHGQVRSFGIASLISWRGVWYVVHFGGIVRPAVGMVDSPATGPGYPGPPGGC